MAIEIECKILIEDSLDIHERLEKSGAIVRKPRVFESNLRYDTPNKALLQQRAILRLRQDEGNRITFKGPTDAQQEGAHTRLELETTVGDWDIMAQILEHIGFQEVMRYEKYRSTYHIPEIAGVEIVLDEMPFGLFIEVEGQAIDQTLEQLGLSEQHRFLESYIELFERVKAYHDLTFNDLTFANFAGITIDPIAFTYGA